MRGQDHRDAARERVIRKQNQFLSSPLMGTKMKTRRHCVNLGFALARAHPASIMSRAEREETTRKARLLLRDNIKVDAVRLMIPS